tara:strand:+ start:734 stop:1165 length:432 start_codon:yes stop_codon:yes gene_type:complete
LEANQINFFSECSFELQEEERYTNWILKAAASEDRKVGEINFIFCDDEYLHKINVEYLDHDTYTDIISFDTTEGNLIGGDIFISVERVRENANEFSVDFDTELRRVLIHGILHFCGYGDKTERDADLMRRKEEEKMEMFHVEQ